MFFLLTNMAVSKYYPSLFTQFIIGIVLYVIAYFLLKDLVSKKTLERYKYYILIFFIFDLVYLVYQRKITKANKQQDTVNNVTSDKITTTENSINIDLTSDINDFHITHEPASEENFDLFSITEETNKSEQTNS